tara:strand:- start:1366 stop:1593 length:228 start_codon:yes stop_codon:yes gene_type:complete
MQKLINVIALLSGLVSLSVVGGGVYLYKNADVMIEEAREKMASAAVEAVSGALPGLIDAAMPDIPEVTGPPINLP